MKSNIQRKNNDTLKFWRQIVGIKKGMYKFK